jgi:hypothetical protein
MASQPHHRLSTSYTTSPLLQAKALIFHKTVDMYHDAILPRHPAIYTWLEIYVCLYVYSDGDKSKLYSQGRGRIIPSKACYLAV